MPGMATSASRNANCDAPVAATMTSHGAALFDGVDAERARGVRPRPPAHRRRDRRRCGYPPVVTGAPDACASFRQPRRGTRRALPAHLRAGRRHVVLRQHVRPLPGRAALDGSADTRGSSRVTCAKCASWPTRNASGIAMWISAPRSSTATPGTAAAAPRSVPATAASTCALPLRRAESRTARAGSGRPRPAAPRLAPGCRDRTAKWVSPDPAGGSQSQITFSVVCTPRSVYETSVLQKYSSDPSLTAPDRLSGKRGSRVTRLKLGSCEIIVGQRWAASTWMSAR